MKLIDLLVKELPKRGGWPEEAKIMSQDAAGLINAHRNERLVFLIDQFWTGTSKNDACKNFSPFYLKKATDWNTNTVTREQYEAALAASKAVVGHDGWIQWAGGECPVDSDAIVEVKFRNPSRNKFNNDRAGDFTWSHDGFGGDIIAYRLQQPTKSEQACDDAAEADDEADLNECIGQGVDTPEWNGEGLPPVGTICQAKVPRSITGWEWRRVKVVESGIPSAEKEVLVYDLETTLPAWTDEFRPLRTEAEMAREKLAASLHIAAGASQIELNGIGPLYFKLADAIISGSVFGITFKAGK